MKRVVCFLNIEKLSDRLATVAKYVPQGAKIADIGSDHAYLPCHLAKNKVIRFAIAGEVAVGPYQSAQSNVQSEGLTDIISVRLGDGLAVLEPDEAECITIAGMGGSLITTILEAGREKLGSVSRLILQPNISAISIRKWFLENNWELISEEIIEEDEKIYEVLVGEKGDPKKPYSTNLEMGLLFGPFLHQRKEEAFIKKWSREMRNWQRIYEQLEGASPSQETIDKRQELKEKIKMVEEVLRNEDSERS
jgi:tRNA (adenine22-N1)-methyltransferase